MSQNGPLEDTGRGGREGGLRAHSSAVPKRLLISKEARDAVTLAHVLVNPPAGRQVVPDDEAVARLRAMNGGRAALREAAGFVARTVKSGYPATRIHRLLLTAADEPVAAPTAAEAAAEDRQRQLAEQPFSVSFQQLAEQVAGLRELEELARTAPESFLRELSRLERLLGGRAAPGAQQFRTTLGMQKAVRRLVGPSSGLSDPILSSSSAERAVTRYLWQVAEIDPRKWGPTSR